MNRYNQFFLKFGPMEQCDDGEWVRFSDHKKDKDEVIEKLVMHKDLFVVTHEVNTMNVILFFIGLIIGMTAMPLLKEYVYQIWPEVWL